MTASETRVTPPPRTWRESWLHGGFPDALVAGADGSRDWHEANLRSYVDRGNLRHAVEIKAGRGTGHQARHLATMMLDVDAARCWMVDQGDTVETAMNGSRSDRTAFLGSSRDRYRSILHPRRAMHRQPNR